MYSYLSEGYIASTDQVLPFLYIGSWDSRKSVADLGVKHVISVLTPNERKRSDYPSELPSSVIEYSQDLDDSEEADLKTILMVCLPIIHEALVFEEAILVHCQAGISRSASVVLAYLMSYKDMTMETAYQHLKGARPCISPNYTFCRQLRLMDSTNY